MNKTELCLALLTIAGLATPALAAPPNRIAARIDNSNLVQLRVRKPAFVKPQNDVGAVEGSFPVSGMSLMLKPSVVQQTELNQLLESQQDAKSPSFHRWLTPDEFGSRFGAASGDIDKILAWLESQGFSVDYVARSRNYITFSGTAAQVSNAFHTSIHRYTVDGETRFANSTTPSIPAALSGVVATVRGLNNLRLKPRLKKPRPELLQGGQVVVAPADFAAIYDVKPLYTAGITGTGQKIVIVGQSAILTSDISQFRTRAGLGTPNLTQVLVPGSPNPGRSQGDEEESDLDIEWAGAIAKDATVVFVYSQDVWSSAMYTVDQNLAPVLSMSYGACEQYDLVDMETLRGTVQQANAEGMTFVSSSGDFAAADCDEFNDNASPIAQGGLAVDTPASIPEVTAMGGTQFNAIGGTYWVGGSATGYVPEIVWNDTIAVDQLDGTGGGASIYFTQPPWQSGIAPADGMRHVPDVSFPASNVIFPYFVYTSDRSSGGFGPSAVGGTSCGAPSMAGVVALLNHYLVSNGQLTQPGLGNINPALYRLAQTTPGAFHDITVGDNIVPCAPGSPNCVNGKEGWAAGPGYDSASGLGSIDVNNLVHGWQTAIATQSVVVPSAGAIPIYQTGTNAWTFTLTLTEEAGIATTLTGFTINGVDHSSEIATLFGSGAIASRGSIQGAYTLTGLDVSSGQVNVTFGFSGADAGGAKWTASMTVPFAGPQAALSVREFNNAASGETVFAPGQLVGVYGTGMGILTQQAVVTPLPEYLGGVEVQILYGPGFSRVADVPLMYVSPNQVNIQIPYGIPAGPAQLAVGTPYDNKAYSFTVSTAAPGIFLYSTGGASTPIGSTSARVGDTIAIYITGQGLVSPPVDDGATPSSDTVPVPQQAVSITVGGIPVATPFAYLGIPVWSVGVTQINFKIPSGVAPGPQPIVVTVGGTSSLPANITIAQ
ncbi:MAG TPA: protease pro-enzyme activation domain-containing protein [Bryobacteraceae bacterium]|nr:protease pro-enzyme activation domain-containing protein [Bryobacteraceae bacterium]